MEEPDLFTSITGLGLGPSTWKSTRTLDPDTWLPGNLTHKLSTGAVEVLCNLFHSLGKHREIGPEGQTAFLYPELNPNLV